MQSPPSRKWSQITNRHFVVVAIVAVFVGIIATIQGTATVSGAGDSDQLKFFFPAAQRILDGNPFTIYAIRSYGYPNYNPPLSTLLMAPLLWIAQTIHLPGTADCVANAYNAKSCRATLGFVGFFFIPFVVLMSIAAVQALRTVYSRLSQSEALMAFALIVLSPLTWQNFTTWWHFEQPMMLFFFISGLVQLQRQRYWFAGVLLGLAALSRTTSIVPLAAILTMLIVEREWQITARLVAMLTVVAAVGIGPFFLLDRRDTTFSLLQWRGSAPIGNSIWSIFIKTPFNSLAAHLDLPITVAAAVVIAVFAVKRLGASAFNQDLYLVVAIAMVLVPMLSKTNWPYYYAEPFVLIVIWEFVSLHTAPVGIWRWPVISLIFLSITATMSQFMGNASATHGGIVLRLMGLAQFAIMGIIIAMLWQRARELADANQHSIHNEQHRWIDISQ